MQEKIDLTVVNPHCLQNVVALAGTHQVTTSEDVYDAKGMKLLAKGAHIDHSVYARLARFKLRRPLECSVTVQDGVNVDTIIAVTCRLMDEVSPVAMCLQAVGASDALLAALRRLPLESVSELLLTTQLGRGPGVLQHSVLAAAIAGSLGIALHLSDDELMQLLLAGLLHDVGELYINPEYLQHGRELAPAEWRHVAIHPHIGELVIQDLTRHPKSVSRAIGEHHERATGFGYPRQLLGSEISKLGQILTLCETLCAMFLKQDRPVERACKAVRVVPGEYPSELVSLMAQIEKGGAAAQPGGAVCPVQRETMRQKSCQVQQLIEVALGEVSRLAQRYHGATLTAVSELLEHIHARLVMLRSALNATGVGVQEIPDDHELVLEAEVVVNEVDWRLRELARQAALKISMLDTSQQAPLQAIVESLTGQPSGASPAVSNSLSTA